MSFKDVYFLVLKVLYKLYRPSTKINIFSISTSNDTSILPLTGLSALLRLHLNIYSTHGIDTTDGIKAVQKDTGQHAMRYLSHCNHNSKETFKL